MKLFNMRVIIALLFVSWQITATNLTNTEVNHKTLTELIFEHTKLLNSSKNKHIVVFLGKTGSGKSTLINFLEDKNIIRQ